MSNAARKGRARKELGNRPANELSFSVRVAPPDGDRDADGSPIPVQLDIELREFTLAERQLVKRVLAKMAQPPDWDDVIVAHAWVVWRRTRPESSLQVWMDHITWGEVLDGVEFADPPAVVWDTTPEDFDPKV